MSLRQWYETAFREALLGDLAEYVYPREISDSAKGLMDPNFIQDNPVNKWYFERSRGTWKLPDTNWTMFWYAKTYIYIFFFGIFCFCFIETSISFKTQNFVMLKKY